MEITQQQLERLISLKSRKSYADLAEHELGDRSLASALRSAIRKYKKAAIPVLPAPEPIAMSKVLHIPYQDTLVIADLHAPYQNAQLLQSAINLALSAGIKHVDIAGDLHNFNSLSTLSKGEPVSTAETDIAHSGQILKVLAYYFDKIHITSGNHDEYWIKKRGGTFQDLIYNEVLKGQLSNQFVVTDYDYMIRGDKWLIGHLSSYDEEAGKLAAKISDLVDMNVAVGHDHRAGCRYGDKGHIGISIGAMLTPDRFYYKVRRLNTFPPFELGFLLLINEKPYHFSETGNTGLNGEFKTFKEWEDRFRQ